MKSDKTKKQTNEVSSEKKQFLEWIHENKNTLLFAGISITVIVATIVGLKNKEAIISLWDSLREKVEKGSLYSSKWFEKTDVEELKKARELVQQDYRNPNLDLDFRNKCWDLLKKIDNVIDEKLRAGKETGFPVHSSGGWYLESD